MGFESRRGLASAEAVNSFRAQHQMRVSSGCPDPYLTFAEARWPSAVMDEIDRAGFKNPSPIQSQAWPVALSGRDCVAIAKTGSGKTLAFLLPGYEQVCRGAPIMIW